MTNNMEILNVNSTGVESLCTFPQESRENIEINSMEIENTPTVMAEMLSVDVADDEISISATELLSREIEHIPCLVEPILHKTGLACISGSSDTGKSSLLRFLCMCVVSGKSDFLGFPIHAEHKRTIYVSTEDDETAIAFLLGKQNEDLQEDKSNLEGLRFIFNTEYLLHDLDETLTKYPSDLVCIDAFSDIYRKSMIEGNQIRGFLNDYSQLAQKHQCLMLFLHHCGKHTENSMPSKNNLLGSQAFEAKMRLVMELRNDKADENLKHLCIVKGNYLPTEYKSESYKLRFTDNMTFINTGERIPFVNLTKSADDRRQENEQTEENRQREMFEVILSDSPLSYTDLCSSIMELSEVSEITAKRKVKAARNAGIIVKGKDGDTRYSYPREALIEDVEPIENEELLEEVVTEELIEEEQECSGESAI